MILWFAEEELSVQTECGLLRKNQVEAELMSINLSKGTKESVRRNSKRRGAEAPYVDFNESLRADAGYSGFDDHFATLGRKQRIGAGDGALDGAANLPPV